MCDSDFDVKKIHVMDFTVLLLKAVNSTYYVLSEVPVSSLVVGLAANIGQCTIIPLWIPYSYVRAHSDQTVFAKLPIP